MRSSIRTLPLALVLSVATLISAGSSVPRLARAASVANPQQTVAVAAALSRHPIDPRIYGAAFANGPTIMELAARASIITIPRTAQLNPPVTMIVDPTVNRHPIDPRIYGASFASAGAITDLGLTLNRWGGNRATRYKWDTVRGNTAKDFFFENLNEAGAFGIGTVDSFINASRGAGAQPVITVPMIGWAAKDATNCSFSVLKYGAQTAADGDCGNGFKLVDGSKVVNVPGDASEIVNSAFQGNWIQSLVNTYGLASNGGVRYYSLDNEPGLWSSSHRDIHPLPVSYDEAWTKMADYGAAIRAKDPGAVITGPEEWEWVALFDSQQDWEAGSSADRNAPAHQGLDYVAYLLKKANEYEHAPGGRRILDVVTIHYYAQGNPAVGGPQINEFSNVVTSDMQLLRNRSTRALWDPDYVDQSWMGLTTYPGTGTLLNGGKPHLIPELKRWVAAYYPGTQVGLTEYNWGADNHINGGTAQADILGIMGREGVDLGVRWETPPTGSFTYDAFKMYRNCDGAHSAFGDWSVSAGGPDPDHVSVFASVRSSDNKLMVMIINKDGDDTPATVSLSHFAPTVGPVIQRFQLTSTPVTGVPAMGSQPNLSVANGAVSLTLPAQSVTLLVMAGTILPPSLNVGADYGGDTRGDVLLRDGGSGSLSMWMMNGSTIVSSAAVGSPGGSYTVAGVGDFNGDGKGDILLRDANGNIGMWIMNGSAIVSGALVGSPGGSYNVVAIGDFNGDGKADILLRDANGTLGLWIMNGPVITAGALVGSPGGSYSVAGVADFNHDGKADILLRDGNGTLGLWLMNGATITAGALVGSPGGSYTVAGVGDFNGDGNADILLRDATGTYGMWLMNGSTIAAGGLVGSPGGGFNVAAVNDYNGDGKADILLRDPTGAYGIWIMNGTTISSGALAGSPGATYTAY